MALGSNILAHKSAFEHWAIVQFGEGKIDLTFDESLGYADDFVSAMFIGFCAGAMTGEIV